MWGHAKIKIFFLFVALSPWVFGSAETSINPSISFVNVGQGNCVVIDCTAGEKILVDCGQSKLPVAPSETPERKLVSRGIELANTIKRSYFNNVHGKVVVLVTHPDDDHLNLIPNIFDNPIPSNFTLVLGGPIGDYFKTDSNKSLINLFRNKRVPIVSLSHDLTSEDFNDLSIQVIEFDKKKKSCLEASQKTQAEELIPDGETSRKNKQKRDNQCRATLEKNIDTYVNANFRHKLKGHIMGKNFVEVVAKSFPPSFCRKFKLEILSANAGQGLMTRKYYPGQFIPVVFDSDANTNSVVLKITHSAQSAILTGDATGVTTDQIISYYENLRGETSDLKADVMMACHHGAETHESNNERWINSTNPKSAIFSCGKKDGYGHPVCSVVDAYADASRGMRVAPHSITCGSSDTFITKTGIRSPVYSTHDAGTITAIFRAAAIDINVGSETFNISKGDEVPLREPEALDRLVTSLSLTAHSPKPGVSAKKTISGTSPGLKRTTGTISGVRGSLSPSAKLESSFGSRGISTLTSSGKTPVQGSLSPLSQEWRKMPLAGVGARGRSSRVVSHPNSDEVDAVRKLPQ